MTVRLGPDECDRLNEFVVIYDAGGNASCMVPEAFCCFAEDSDHADEQCQDAYPDCTVLEVYEGYSGEDALDDYADNSINTAIRRLNE